MIDLGWLAWLVAALSVGVVLGFVVAGRRARGRAVRRPVEPTVPELGQRALHSARNGIAVLSESGDVLLHNPRAVELGVVHNLRPDPAVWRAAQHAMQLGEPVQVDLSPETASGRRPRAVHAHARPLGDGFVVVDATDESDAVRLEQTRRDFVANVSHELKTPVGALALLAEAVLDGCEDPEQVRHFATKILAESTRLGALVTELITLSRLQGAEALPELGVVEVDVVVREALARCRLAAESAGIEITADDPSGLLVKGDRTLLVTALANLVDNAIAYSPPASPVSVSRRLVGDTVEIAVTDRGIGIAPEHQQRVFERFFRVDPARSRATGGTGLGLAIVKHVAANHGGQVRLWSRRGTGSTFTLCIPAAVVPGAEAPAHAASTGGRP